MEQKVPFIYREFYDVPRMIILRRRHAQILLESTFDRATEEYASVYNVFQLPDISEDQLQGSWEHLSSKATKLLGQIPVVNVEFDATKRKQLNADFIDDLLSQSD
jgi:hypothetical protein